ncbi:MAG: transpeptidase family protein [Candidatus Symbiothrix sp.]|jgi:cell division protein FtsI (penicillin-binding protein 3)|nr:transpeptidase family protein [Candidatus Symbiothrix sp.]
MGKQESSDKMIQRYVLVAVLIIVAGIYIFAHACIISIRDGNAWRSKISLESDSVLIPTERGDIYASNGEILATNQSFYRLTIDMWAQDNKKEKTIDSIMKYRSFIEENFYAILPDSVAGRLMQGLNNAIDAYNNYPHTKKRNRSFKLSNTAINYIEMIQLKNVIFGYNKKKEALYYLNNPNLLGIRFNRINRRVNPYGTLALRTIGGVYTADTVGRRTGKNGLELYYDSLLAGVPGMGSRRKINGAQIVIPTIRRPERGKDIVTTIDIDIQDITEKTLKNKLRELDAESGTAVVMEVATGEVKAITNMGRVSEGVWSEAQNYAVSDLSEPGSTFKVVSMMVALEDGLVQPDTPVDTEKGIVTIAGSPLKDHNYNRGGYGMITAAKSIRYSSNIGVAKLILQAYGNDPGKYVDGIYRIGLQTDMHLEIPGYAVPRIRHPKDSKAQYWSRTTLPWMSFGYETQIPPIYTLAFFNAIANNGTLLKPIFVKEIRNAKQVVERIKPQVINERICSESTLLAIRQMLDSVVNAHDGTGKPAHSDLISISGKTGTAQLWTAHGREGHQVSFCGYFPSEKPQYSIIVVIRQPRNGVASGGQMCGSVFKSIAEQIYARNILIKENDFPSDTIHPQEAVVKQSYDKTQSADLIPNVKGMGAKDAVYAMEQAGLRVHLSGQGTVVSQSIAAGSKIIKGQTIGLQLQ